MKKLLGIVVLGLLWCSIGFAENNLKGIKQFKLLVDQTGKCDGVDYIDDLTISAKYILGNSKIKLTKEYGGEYLYIKVITVSTETTCASTYRIETFNYSNVTNSAGNSYYGTVTSYEASGISFNRPISDHKKAFISYVESALKEFVVAWIEAQN